MQEENVADWWRFQYRTSLLQNMTTKSERSLWRCSCVRDIQNISCRKFRLLQAWMCYCQRMSGAARLLSGRPLLPKVHQSYGNIILHYKKSDRVPRFLWESSGNADLNFSILILMSPHFLTLRPGNWSKWSWRTFSSCTKRRRGMRSAEASWGAMSENAQVHPTRKSFLSKNLTHT